MTRNVMWVALLVLAVSVVAGCGGGNKDTDTTTNNFVVTGTVRDVTTNSAVVGAKVRVGTYEATTNGQGAFRIEMTTTPVVRIYSVDGRAAAPSPGYFDFWARADGRVQNAKCIELPIIPKGETSLGAIYLMNADSPPPFPPSCPQ